MRRIAIYILIATTLVGCFKDEIYRTDIIFKCSQQAESNGSYEELAGAIAYEFAADTTDYMVASYEDALQGVLTHRTSGAKLAARSTSTASPIDGFESAISLNTSGELVVLLVVDTEHEDYAYTNYSMGLNLSVTYISLLFRPWKEGWFVQNKWQFVVPEPTVTEEEEEETEEEEEEEVETDIEDDEEQTDEEIETDEEEDETEDEEDTTTTEDLTNE